MTQFYAYLHAKPDGSIFYVGKGTGTRAYNFKNRGARHLRVSAKYGVENILVGKIDCSSEEIAFDLEKGIIKCLRKMGTPIINVTSGGEGASGYKHSESELEARRIRNSGVNNPWFGKKHTDEVKQVISQASKVSGGQKKNWTAARKEVVRLRTKQWLADNGHPMEGKKHNENTLALLSESHKGLTLSEASRRKVSDYVKGTTLVTDGKTTIRVPHNEVETYCNNGYEKGCGRMRELRWMNDGKVDSRVPVSEVEHKVLSGWVLGRLRGKRGKSK